MATITLDDGTKHYMSDEALQRIGARQYRQRDARRRGWRLVPAGVKASAIDRHYGLDVDGQAVYRVECSHCGHRLKLNSFVWQLRHMRKHREGK